MTFGLRIALLLPAVGTLFLGIFPTLGAGIRRQIVRDCEVGRLSRQGEPVNRKLVFIVLLSVALWHTARLRGGTAIQADPSNYRARLKTLGPGDTLHLAAGTYTRLPLTNVNGTPEAWITITGPESGKPAVIAGEEGYNTVEIRNSSYLAIENLRIDSRGIPGAFGISATGHESNVTHHIRIEGNTLVGQNGGQQTDAISTKTPTWGWIIRYNQILNAGTGLYLGDSDGTQPFVNGLIENNLIKDTIGYNMEIKDQNSFPDVPGLPTGPTSTIIRHNVFIKNDQTSPDGDRPNLLVSGFPASGAGSMNMYEIYGNYFLHNHHEALFQGSGRISLHDNIFVDGPYSYPAVVLRKQNNPLKVALVYNNTIYTTGKGIYFGSRAETFDAVVGNVVFGSMPISGQIIQKSNNVVDSMTQSVRLREAAGVDGPDGLLPSGGPVPGTRRWIFRTLTQTPTIAWISMARRRFPRRAPRCIGGPMRARGAIPAGSCRQVSRYPRRRLRTGRPRWFGWIRPAGRRDRP